MTTEIDGFIRPTDFRLPGGEWFVGAGFGLFVHWDHASQQGIEISWPLVGRSIIPGVDEVEDMVTVAQYQSSASTFDPIAWDAGELARAAKRAGARYVVFTARHHAGYAMFHTEHSEFGIRHSPFGRDITREFVEAIRAEGIRVGIYYSLSDWNHPDYPAFTDDDRPYPEEHWPGAGLEENIGQPIREDRHRRPTPEQWARYQQFLRGQLTELLTGYGTIDLLWFDGEWERSEEEWDSAGLRAHIKSLQPDVVINERLLGQGDYKTPEQAFPITAPDGPWELCLTIGDMWAWRPSDTNTKSVRSLVSTLIEVASRGGNLLLNIGPKGDGSLNPVQVETLEHIGEWMQRHEESVIGVSPTQGVDFYGPTTARAGTVYLHLLLTPVEELVVRGLPVRRVQRVRLLQTGEELPFRVGFEVHELASRSAEPLGELRIPAPAPTGAAIDVVAIDFA
ncbi:alpha-L-fucosidase [Diaminobutyricimonas aerilata]|uniref:alpha-L-fucosidase n=1 Tax=Diaminobutyricimonas aerilata TaxID=1162967 RepID=A0A2M9CN75_9MICO|nr:alpha-L-fucosidase [Diaminobutyricimonas aerilata]PJJ73345.1 alpha-L-fucosidase [Diaminobutyricimonas aerilata]